MKPKADDEEQEAMKPKPREPNASQPFAEPPTPENKGRRFALTNATRSMACADPQVRGRWLSTTSHDWGLILVMPGNSI